MSDIETRLREALTARAELVRPEDLTRGVPEPEPRLPWWRHPGTYLVAAASVAVATVSVVALVVGSSDQAGRKPGFTDSDSPSSTTTATVTMPATWGTAPDPQPGNRWTGDVDGDGRPDQVSLTDGTTLSVTTASASLGTSVDGPEVTLGGLVTVPGNPTPVITVQATEGAAGTTYTTWHLFVVRSDRLVELKVSSAPGVQNQATNGVPGGHDVEQTWLTTDTGAAGEIFTMQYVDQGTPVDGSAYPGSGDTVYRVRVWHWLVDGTDLRPELLGGSCVVPPSTAFVDCP